MLDNLNPPSIANFSSCRSPKAWYNRHMLPPPVANPQSEFTILNRAVAVLFSLSNSEAGAALVLYKLQRKMTRAGKIKDEEYLHCRRIASTEVQERLLGNLSCPLAPCNCQLTWFWQWFVATKMWVLTLSVNQVLSLLAWLQPLQTPEQDSVSGFGCGCGWCCGGTISMREVRKSGWLVVEARMTDVVERWWYCCWWG